MHDESRCRQELSRIMADLYRRGWCEGTGGNFSCVLSRSPLHLLMVPSGVHKGEVSADALIVVNQDAQVIDGTGRASAETLLHLAIVQATGAGAVLHTHSHAATLLSQRIGRHQSAELWLEGLEMLKGLEGITTHNTGVAVPVLPNDQDLQRLSEAALPLLTHAPFGLLIAGHGLYAWGADLVQAKRHLEILEFLLEQRWRELLLDPSALQSKRFDGLTHVLLDIEGTTCPVSFVSEVLFPYAATHLESYLAINQHNSQVRVLVSEAEQAWRGDAEAASAGLVWQAGVPVASYLLWLIQQDRKLTALKELQGLIWQQGYANGELKGPLFSDVPPALHRWHHSGLQLAVYSSGSVAAQQLLYGHCQAGDLRNLFSHWFDTRIGQKHDSASYALIAEHMACAPSSIMFISDSTLELQAARGAGMQVLFSDREGNPNRDAAGFEKMSSFSTLQLSP